MTRNKKMNIASIALLGVLFVMVFALAVYWRGENIFSLSAACFMFFWLFTLPGALTLSIVERKPLSPGRLLVAGTALGVALYPIVHHLFYPLVGWAGVGITLAFINLFLFTWLLAKKKNQIEWGIFKKPDAKTIKTVACLLIVVLFVVASREMSQLKPDKLEIKSTQEVDAGYLMGVAAALKNNGNFVDIHNGNAPASYHYFAYLLMAAVSRFSGASILMVFQVIFPLLFFSFFALAIYRFTAAQWQNRRVAFLTALAALFLDDFSVLNQFAKKMGLSPGVSPFYVSWAIPNIHLSPSQLVSLFLLFVVLHEIYNFSRGDKQGASVFFIICVLTGLAAFKVSTWLCLMAGLGIASLLSMKQTRKFLAITLAAGMSGLVLLFVLAFRVTSHSAMPSPNIGFPVLANSFILNLFGFRDGKIGYSELSVASVLLIIILIPLWLLLTYGARIFWLVGFKNKVKNIVHAQKFIWLTVFVASLFGILVSLLFSVEEFGSANAYYFSIFGMFAVLPFAMPDIFSKIARKNVTGFVILGLVLTQCASGFLYIVKPHLKKDTICVLSPDWLAGMAFLKNSTPKSSMIISNRFDFSEKPEFSNYREKFYFIPGLAERAVVISGVGYMRTGAREYWAQRGYVQQLLLAGSASQLREALQRLPGDYLLLDKWQGESLGFLDISVLKPVFSNRALEIYQVLR